MTIADFGLATGSDVRVGATTKTILNVSIDPATPNVIEIKYKNKVENKDGSTKSEEQFESFDLSNPESLDALLVRIPRLEGDEELAAKELIMAKMAMIEKNKNASSNSSYQPPLTLGQLNDLKNDNTEGPTNKLE
jgi:hypothetical protein